MLNYKVRTICDKHFSMKGKSDPCEGCPLAKTCLQPTDKLPGKNIREKSTLWEERMNKAAEGVSV